MRPRQCLGECFVFPSVITVVSFPQRFSSLTVGRKTEGTGRPPGKGLLEK